VNGFTCITVKPRQRLVIALAFLTLDVRHMASKSDLYRERAADFENKARLTSDPSAKIAYFELAHAYLQLAEHIERVLAKEREDKK